VVGEALANGFLKYGHKVMRGSRDTSKLADWLKRAASSAATGSFEETARFGDIVVLAARGSAAESVLKLCGHQNLRGKTIIDTTNPIAEELPVNGVLKYFTDINESLMERLQRLVPDAHFVKAFSCVGSAHMVDPDFGGIKPTMFICGNDAGSKATVGEILTRFGWEIEDLGVAEAARAIEPLAMLYCIPGFLKNQWGQAFKLMKK
jgi:hypothetical protein